MAVACIKVITPALTKPIAITVVAADDWIIAVTEAPMPTPAKRLLLILPSKDFILLPAIFSRLDESIFIPAMKTPLPASRAKIQRNTVIY